MADIDDKLKFEDLKKLNFGDQITMRDPLGRDAAPYVLMSKIEVEGQEDFYFIDGNGSSLVIKEQQTIDGFNVRLVEKSNPLWDKELCEQGKLMGDMLQALVEEDDSIEPLK